MHCAGLSIAQFCKKLITGFTAVLFGRLKKLKVTMMVQRIKQAVIPSTGLVTGMLLGTKAIPKDLLPVADHRARSERFNSSMHQRNYSSHPRRQRSHWKPFCRAFAWCFGPLETTVASVGDLIQLTDALDELLKLDGLNVLRTTLKSLSVVIKKVF